MKKSIFFILLFLCSATGIAFSQTENTASRELIARFQQYYNAEQPDSIFNLFSPETKILLPLQKTKTFLSQLQSNFGKIKKSTFINYQGAFSVYKTELEKGTIQLSLSFDQDKKITGLYAKPQEDQSQQSQKRNVSKMHPPFTGEWTVFWGGDTKEQNYHVVAKMQKNAFDMIITDQADKSYKTNGKDNEDYYAFGKNILAPCDAEVVFAVDGIKDNTPGAMNKMYTLGNSVLLKTQHNEYILLAHFKQGSIKVRQGDQLKTGQLIAQCGNSGNSSEPHLHFHIQDKEDFNSATGIKCFFDKIMVNGTVKTDYSPVKGDRIK